jgi:hypothetical protein
VRVALVPAHAASVYLLSVIVVPPEQLGVT